MTSTAYMEIDPMATLADICHIKIRFDSIL